MRAQSTGGFSLVEALVGLALFTVLMAAVSQYLLSVPRVNVRTNDTQRVTLGAKTYFEQTGATLAANFDTPTSGLPTPPSFDGQACTATVTAPVGGSTSIKRVSLSCTVRGNTYTLARDYGRAS